MKAVVKEVNKSMYGYEKVTFMTIQKDITIDLLNAGLYKEGQLVTLEYVPFANAWKIGE